MRICLVTGAPGSGKTATVEAVLKEHNDFLVFDMDWLLGAASKLAKKSVQYEPSTWQPYGELWFEFLVMVCKNGKTPVLFGPIDENGIPKLATKGIKLEWLLLDCPDAVRRMRLERRNWSESQIDEAILDAAVLRKSIVVRSDTSEQSVEDVARQIRSWVGSF